MAQYRLCIDQGHGGSDPGAVGNGLQEKDVNLIIGNMVREYLKRYSEVYVFRTRGDDSFVSLRTRCGIANENKADLFVSFHSNAGGGSGFESYVCPGANRAATAQRIIHQQAYQFMQGYGVQESLPMTVAKEDWRAVNQLDSDAVTADIDDRGQKIARFYVLLHTNMPAVLFETLFVDNAEDAKLLKDQQFLEGVAKSYAQGIVKFFGLELSDNPGELRQKIDLLEQQLGDCKRACQELEGKLIAVHDDLTVIARRSKKYLNNSCPEL